MHDIEKPYMGINTVTQNTSQYLTFMLGGKSYGLEILNIKEIIEFGEITEVPRTPEYISGVINLRGKVVPVIDLHQFFSGAAIVQTKRTSIIVMEVESDGVLLEIGVTVDMVNEVLDLNLQDIDPAPPLGSHIDTRFICGMAKLENQLLILLEIKNIFSADDLSLVGVIQQDGTT